MRLYYHLSLPYLTNTYLVGPAGGGDAIVIDPGAMDVQLLELVEKHRYYIRSILVTNPDPAHTGGIKTLLKIYEAAIYSGQQHQGDFPNKCVFGGETVSLHGFQIQVLSAQGFSREAVMYRIENCLFSGDAITAGMVGNVANVFSRALLVSRLKETFSRLPPETLLFPASGPPTTLELERNFNPDLSPQPQKEGRPPAF
ncbi:MAG: MBL fold metallo-hydrolase [Spirochaetia bacterium]|jgi:glyoxylase-like metal-dependent hydrolase (beta-lactamase superfamily II)|nr:MBL fold metallo-hydrolase [Spirochaetia bacterium]